MNEETTNESAEPVETTTEDTTESLDEIASSFNVEDQASQFQAQPQQPAPAPEPQFNQYQNQSGIPDPISNPDGYDFYMQQQAQQSSQIQQTLNQLAEKVQGYEQQATQQKVDADVEKAVSVINSKLNVDPQMAEVAMEVEYRNNPAFKKIWDNRDKNPAAYNKALGVIADKWSSKFANKADPQLAENVRAAKTSQQTMANAPATDKDDEWSNLSPGEFALKWSQTKNG